MTTPDLIDAPSANPALVESRLRELARRDHAVALVLFLVIFVTYFASLASTRMNSDAFANSFGAWHLAHTGSPFFDHVDVPEIVGPDYFGPNSDGHVVLSRQPGQIWAAVPFYALLSGADRSDFTTGPGQIASAFWSAAAMALLFLGLCRGLSRRAALASTLVVAFGTPVWSVAAATLWPHVVTVLGLCGAVLALNRNRFLWAGIAFGIALLARPHIALIAGVVGVGLAISRRSPRVAMLIGLGSGLMLGVLVSWNHYVYGAWSVTGGYAQSVGDMVPGSADETRLGGGYLGQLAGFFFSPDKGFLVWTPLALVLLPLLWRCRAHVRDWMWWLALGGVVFSLAQVALDEFTGGDGFNGYRLALELLICLTPACATVAAHAGRMASRLIAACVVYQVSMTAVAALRQDYVPEIRVWHDNSTLVALRDSPVPSITVGVVAAVVASAGCWWFSRSRPNDATPA